MADERKGKNKDEATLNYIREERGTPKSECESSRSARKKRNVEKDAYNGA